MAIVRMRRTDSATAALASSATCSRRPCSRSSDEIVCRLFFTRWWISRIVASFDSSSRSRWRSSVTSRSSSTPPVTSPPAEDRDAARQQGDVGGLVELLDDGLAALEGLPDGRVVEARARPGACPTALALMPTRCERRHGVRRGVAARGRRRRATITPSPTAGRRRRRRSPAVEREACPRRSSPRSGGRCRGRCAPARPAGGRSAATTPASARRSTRPVAAHRDGQHAGSASGRPSTVDLALDDLAGPVAPACSSGRSVSLAARADPVDEVERLAGGRADLAEDQPAAVAGAARRAAGRRSRSRPASPSRPASRWRWTTSAPVEVRVLPSELRRGWPRRRPSLPDPAPGRPAVSASSDCAEPDQAGQVVDVGSSRIGHGDQDVRGGGQLGALLGLPRRDDRRSWRSSRATSASTRRTRVVGRADEHRRTAVGQRRRRRRGRRDAITAAAVRAAGRRAAPCSAPPRRAAACGRCSSATKNSASWAGAASSVVTTQNVVRGSPSSWLDARGPG